jgi:hypothetical protein
MLCHITQNRAIALPGRMAWHGRLSRSSVMPLGISRGSRLRAGPWRAIVATGQPKGGAVSLYRTIVSSATGGMVGIAARFLLLTFACEGFVPLMPPIMPARSRAANRILDAIGWW